MPIFSNICSCGYSNIRVELQAEHFSLRIFCLKCNKPMIHESRLGDVPKKEPEKAPQRQFAHYSVLKKLGEGGMAIVYLALDNDTKEKVALKIFKKTQDKNFVKYIIREGEILLKLQHPNIVSLKNWGNHQGYPYLVMEYIPGHNLAELIKENPLEPVDAVQIMLYIIEALIHASEYQIIHRDIKPDNVIISEDGVVKLIDMGVGKMLEDSGVLTETGEIVGTCFYMPAEQLRNSKRVDFRADMYGIGATLFHALCGVPPYYEYGDQINKLIFSKINENFISLAERNEKLPLPVINIVKKAMAHNSTDRYQTFFEMKEEWLKVYGYLSSKI